MNAHVIGLQTTTLIPTSHHVSGVIQDGDSLVTYVCETAPVARPSHPYLAAEGGAVTAYCGVCDADKGYRVLDVEVQGEPPMVCRHCGSTPAYNEVGWAPNLSRWNNTGAGWECPACA